MRGNNERVLNKSRGLTDIKYLINSKKWRKKAHFYLPKLGTRASR